MGIFMFVCTTVLYEYMNSRRNNVCNLFANTHVWIKICHEIYHCIIYVVNEGSHVRIVSNWLCCWKLLVSVTPITSWRYRLKTITSVLKVMTNIITSITALPIDSLLNTRVNVDLHNCHYIYIYIYIREKVTLRLYNILYFLWLYNEFFIILYNILKIAELDCCQIIILSIYVPSTQAYTHVLRLSLDLPYEKR